MTNNIQWVAFITLMRREVVRVFRIWPQTLLPPVMTTTLYFLIFGHVIGSRIGTFHGYDYIQFIVPGLIMLSIITSSYSNVSSTFFSAKFQRNIEEMLVSPMSNITLLLGFLTGGILRGIIVGILVSAVAMFFTTIPIHHLFLVLVTVILASGLFSLAGFLNALFARKFDDIAIVPTFVLNPLTYLGGIFYSVDLLPPFWKTISLFNPILHLVNLFRYGFLGISDVSVWRAFFFLCGLTFLFLMTCLFALKHSRGLRH